MPSARPTMRGSRFHEGPNGVTVIQPYTIDGLTASTEATRFLWEAKQINGLPQIGEEHPDIKGIFCEDRELMPYLNSKVKAKAILTYRNMTIRFNGVASQQQTHFDALGQPMEVRYKAGYTVRGPVDGGIPQLAEASVLRPGNILEFERYNLGKKYNPMLTARRIIGCTNSEPWQSAPAHTWLCIDYSVNEISGTGKGPWYEKLAFQFKGYTLGDSAEIIEDHRHLALYIDPHLRIVPPGLNPISFGYPQEDEGNGFGRFIVQPTLPFDTLALPDVFEVVAA